MIRQAAITTLPRGISFAAITFAAGLTAGSFIGSPIGGGFLTGPTAAASVSSNVTRLGRRAVPGSHPAELVRVIDGDTFVARVAVWPGIDITTKVRLRGIDAPEMHARCAQERSEAEAAREALRAMLTEGNITVERVGLGKYAGRVLADVATRATPDVSTAMLAKGLARPYRGGRRKPWCSGA